jgi:hypothetical protein
VIDQTAFNQLSIELSRQSWIHCNDLSADPCEVCPPTNDEYFIRCEIMPITSTSSRRLHSNRNLVANSGFERRITGIKLRNVGIVGTIPVSILNSFSALTILDLSSNSSKPFGNQLTAPADATGDCVAVDICKKIDCNFGAAVKSCYSPEGEVSQLSSGAIAGIVLGVLAVMGIFLVIGLAVYRGGNLTRRQQLAGTSQEGRGKSFSESLKRTISGSMKTTRSFRRPYTPKGETPDNPGTWIETFDPVSKAKYWMNNVTGEFSWGPPPVSNGRAASQQMPKDWLAYEEFGAFGNEGTAEGAFTSNPLYEVSGGDNNEKLPKAGIARAMTTKSVLKKARAVKETPEPPLPQAVQDTWEELYDSATDRSYWVSALTKQISYTPPPGQV